MYLNHLLSVPTTLVRAVSSIKTKMGVTARNGTMFCNLLPVVVQLLLITTLQPYCEHRNYCSITYKEHLI